ncbi:MAG: hypothetical protein L0312_17895 [Acidobacteria bacterium]|nr:hypothetical protein [Acidobacteriota bacterium]
MVNRVEAIVDILGKLNGMGDPESEAYALRNPLLIRSFARPGKHETDDGGRRIFSSLLSGYKAGVFDCQLKLSGKSRAGLKPTDTLTNLLGVYGVKELGGIGTVVNFLRKALKDDRISKNTPLSYFVSEDAT